MNPATPKRVIIDTDPGLDDVIALLLALASPELDILGIVTVGGNISIDLTTRNALRVLALAGRTDIPVIAGAAAPLRRPTIDVPGIHGDDGIGGIDLPAPSGQASGVDAMEWLTRTLEASPASEITLLTLGPLTNIAALIEARPEIARRLAGIVAMGGAVRDRGNVSALAEFNIAADPEAADVVIRSGIPLVLVPLDVTRRVSVGSAWGAALAESGGTVAQTASRCIDAYIANIAELRKKGAPAARASGGSVEEIRCPLHDPCVILWILFPGLFTVERLPLRVVTDGSDADGATIIDQAAGSLVDVVIGADATALLALAADRLSAADSFS